MDESLIYHIWFGTKLRKWLLFGEVEQTVKELMWSISHEKGIDLIDCETMVDHMHLLLKSPSSELPKVVHFLKGISSRRIFQAFPELKLDANTNSFWQRRYGARIVAGQAVAAVLEYIRTQKERPEKFDKPWSSNLGCRSAIRGEYGQGFNL